MTTTTATKDDQKTAIPAKVEGRPEASKTGLKSEEKPKQGTTYKLSKREEALDAASQIISGQQNFPPHKLQSGMDRIAAIWNAQLAGQLTEPITTKQVGEMLIGFKLARIAENPEREDALIDIIGYAAIATEVH